MLIIVISIYQAKMPRDDRGLRAAGTARAPRDGRTGAYWPRVFRKLGVTARATPRDVRAARFVGQSAAPRRVVQ